MPTTSSRMHQQQNTLEVVNAAASRRAESGVCEDKGSSISASSQAAAEASTAADTKNAGSARFGQPEIKTKHTPTAANASNLYVETLAG